MGFKLILDERMEKWKKGMEENKNIYKNIQLPDAKSMDAGSSKEMDRYLFMMTHRIGYGKWNEIYAKLMRHPYFRLNFLLRAMGPSRLKYRVDQILRACSKKTTKKRNSPESSMNASVSLRSPSKDDEESEPPSNKRRKMIVDK